MLKLNVTRSGTFILAINIDGIVATVKEMIVQKKAVRPIAGAHKIDRITLTRYISKLNNKPLYRALNRSY